MGETSAKLRQIFDLMQQETGVYLFYEFDATPPSEPYLYPQVKSLSKTQIQIYACTCFDIFRNVKICQSLQ
jgi:hypothetical protein